jgi:hypothetical protein
MIILSALISIGIASSGWFIADGFYRAKTSDQYVSVKGLAEQTVKADIAIWDINYKLAGNDLENLSEQSIIHQKKIIQFLIDNGFSYDMMRIQQTSVIDKYAKEYSNDKPTQRYIIQGGITVKTSQVALVQKVSQKTGELIKAGIIITAENYTANPSYLFTNLDKIRPHMLEMATKSARLAAQQFAIHSNSHLGGIRRASQGVFQIFSAESDSNQGYRASTDQPKSIDKKVRVVVSIDYFIKKQI